MKPLIITATLSILVLGGLSFYFFGGSTEEKAVTTQGTTTTSSDNSVTTTGAVPDAEDKVFELQDGTYVLDAAKSTFNWSGKKPLIDGYVNTGTIAFTEGLLTKDPKTIAGTFVLDMNTLSVSDTPTKPGQESALESHLKGENWFDVAQYPTANITIRSLTPRADVEETKLYDVIGSLTMHGVTEDVRFMVTVDIVGNNVRVEGKYNFNRTKWGITTGSSSFVDNLGDNAIDDIVPLTFTLVATKQ